MQALICYGNFNLLIGPKSAIQLERYNHSYEFIPPVSKAGMDGDVTAENEQNE